MPALTPRSEAPTSWEYKASYLKAQQSRAPAPAVAIYQLSEEKIP